jgi:hypothetical protein
VLDQVNGYRGDETKQATNAAKNVTMADQKDKKMIIFRKRRREYYECMHGAHLVHKVALRTYSMLRNSGSGPEIGLPGQILAGLLPGHH